MIGRAKARTPLLYDKICPLPTAGERGIFRAGTSKRRRGPNPSVTEPKCYRAQARPPSTAKYLRYISCEAVIIDGGSPQCPVSFRAARLISLPSVTTLGPKLSKRSRTSIDKKRRQVAKREASLCSRHFRQTKVDLSAHLNVEWRG